MFASTTYRVFTRYLLEIRKGRRIKLRCLGIPALSSAQLRGVLLLVHTASAKLPSESELMKGGTGHGIILYTRLATAQDASQRPETKAVTQNKSRQIVTILNELCEERDILITSFSDDWLYRLEKNGCVSHVLGYDFAINFATARTIAKDKAATCMIFRHVASPRRRSSGSFTLQQWLNIFRLLAIGLSCLTTLK